MERLRVGVSGRRRRDALDSRNRKSSGLERGRGESGSGLPDFVPDLIATSPGFCREGNHRGGRIGFRQAFQSVAQLVVGEAVAFGGDEEKIAAGGIEEIQELPVAGL